MALRFGLHTGPQDVTINDLRRAWRRADEAGFFWCSVWDHFTSLSNAAGPCFEGVAAIVRSVNVGLVIGQTEAEVRREEALLEHQFGPLLGLVRDGIMVGTPRQIVDQVGAYQRAGAELVIVALRAPFDWGGLELFISEVMPAFS
jgi:alkanesulfonate monooxygenase SsuD/methylene tetrahydromethanopterin reductase-like flavin-dependent oxidoreductase (luciferase family)